MNVIDRIYARVMIDANGCHLWLGAKTKAGYGLISVNDKRHYVHRLSYEAARGAVQKGLSLDHLYRVRHCCNPDHLEPVTPAENNLRGNGFAAINARKTHFACGHPIIPENTYFLRRRSRPREIERACRTCRRRKSNEYYYEKIRNHSSSK